MDVVVSHVLKQILSPVCSDLYSALLFDSYRWSSFIGISAFVSVLFCKNNILG